MAKKGIDKTELAIAEAEVFEVYPNVGLSPEQVGKRKAAKLVNKTPRYVSKSYLRIVRDNVFNLLNLYLVVVVALMIWAKLTWSYYLFALIIVADIVIGLAQDIQARRLTDKLEIVASPKVKVLRSGQEVLLDKDEIVLSDIILLEAGNQIPADCRIVMGSCKIDESIITGEGDRLERKEGETLYSGSYVVSGKCRATITAIGSASYAEKLQKKASFFARPSSQISSFIWRVVAVCSIVSLLLAVAGVLSYGLAQNTTGESFWDRINPATPGGHQFFEGLTGLIVAMLPAGMFLLASLSLTVGVIQLSKRKVFVQDLHAIESLSRVDAICFDKTGTLTTGAMSVTDVTCMKGFHRAEVGYAIASILHHTQDHNLTSDALREYFGDHSADSARLVMPFDPNRKNSYITLDVGVTYAMGAYDFLPVKKDPKVEEIIAENAKKGIRTLVLCIAEKTAKGEDLPSNMPIAALISIVDHIREDASENVAALQQKGVSIYLISGDDAALVSYLGELAGVKGYEHYVNLTGKTDEEILALVRNNKIFGRALPEQKALIVAELKRQGHRVAMVGDGVNDILAMKEASASVAMASGSDATKNVAHFVSLDNGFSSLPQILSIGRRVIHGLERTCSLFLSKTFFAGAVATISLILSFFVKMPGTDTPFYYPFSLANLVVWEMFAIALPAFFFIMEQGDDTPVTNAKKNIIANFLPAGIIEVLIAAVPFLLAAFAPDIIASGTTVLPAAKTFAVISFTAFAFVFLAKVFNHMNWLRFIIFTVSLLLGAGCFVIDYFVGGSFLGLSYDTPPLTYIFTLLGTVGGAILLFALVITIENLKNKEKQI